MRDPVKCSGHEGPCEETQGLQLEDSRTMYYWNGDGDDPNSPILLCRECARAHHSWWDEQWAEVYHGNY
jgi:hypothetical protein